MYFNISELVYCIILTKIFVFFTESELFCFFVFQMLSKRHSFMQYLINLADQGIVHDVPDLRDRVQQLLNLIPSGKSLSSLPLFTVSGFYTLEKQT